MVADRSRRFVANCDVSANGLLRDYPTTKAIVSFPLDQPIPQALVKKLVKASIKAMKERGGKRD